jgi:hypothetical protein
VTGVARQDEGVITEDGTEANPSKEKPAIETYWSRGPPHAMARHLQMVIMFYSNMVAAYKELYIAEAMIMVMVIYATVGSLQPKIEQSTEYEIVDDEPGEQDISALPAQNEDKKEHLMIKLRKRLQSMVQIKKGLTIDSGAADHVMPLGWLIWILVVASAGSLKGLHYVAASGTRISNMGQQTVNCLTRNGTWAQWIFQVAAVNKPLVSVSKLIDDGWRVVFDEEASYIKHKQTGNVINIRRERGVFVVDAFVDPADPKKNHKGQVFTRPT